MILSIAAFLLVLGVLVAVHELGHMLAAKACGVAVPEFAVGFGPKLFGFKRGETAYAMRMIPLGGYCAIAGLADDVVDAPGADSSGWDFPMHRTWQAKNGWQKAFILVAGPVMNFLLALIVIIAMGFIGFSQAIIMVSTVQPGSPAEETGLLPGDILVALDGAEVENVHQFQSIVQNHANQALTIGVQRGSERIELTTTPRTLGEFNDNAVSLGIGLDIGILSNTRVSMIQPKSVGYGLKLRTNDIVTHVNGRAINHGWELMTYLAIQDQDGNLYNREGDPLPGDTPAIALSVQRGNETLEFEVPADTTLMTLGLMFHPELEQLPVGQSIMRSLEEATYMTLGIFSMVKLIFSSEGAKSLAGPVGIFSLVGQSAHSGWYSFLQMAMMISFSLGFFNLLPIPALDGGRLVFVALHGIGIRIPPQREMAVHMVGMMMILGLILLMTVFDVMALFRYNQP